MKVRLSRWGIGPYIALACVPYAIVAEVITNRWPQLCRVPLVPYGVLSVMAAVLLIARVSMLVIAARAVTRAYNSDQLMTSGMFALVRNPIYSAWLVFIIPGLALLGRSWPLLLTPVLGYAVFKRLIHREDGYLRQRFGKTYLDYRAQVSELIPIPRGRAPHAH